MDDKKKMGLERIMEDPVKQNKKRKEKKKKKRPDPLVNRSTRFTMRQKVLVFKKKLRDNSRI